MLEALIGMAILCLVWFVAYGVGYEAGQTDVFRQVRDGFFPDEVKERVLRRVK